MADRPVMFDQEHGIFVPRVQAMRVTQPLKVKNHDSVVHTCIHEARPDPS